MAAQSSVDKAAALTSITLSVFFLGRSAPPLNDNPLEQLVSEASALSRLPPAMLFITSFELLLLLLLLLLSPSIETFSLRLPLKVSTNCCFNKKIIPTIFAV
jgi:hypothetical protein